MSDELMKQLGDALERARQNRKASELDERRAAKAEEYVRGRIADALRAAGTEAEFRFRKVTFFRGDGCSSVTELHPVGDWLRERADEYAPASDTGGERNDSE